MDAIAGINKAQQVPLLDRIDTDERIVRKELAKVWTEILKRYAKPGAAIPDEEALRSELIHAGTNAGVNALIHEHWYVFDWMVRPKVEEKIIEELEKFDLVGFIEEVKEVQQNPQLLNALIAKIRRYVLE